MSAGSDIAVVSHGSALELYGLADIAPATVHLTLPRAYRYRNALVSARYHYPREPLRNGEVRRVQGIRVTSPERTIVDVLETGTQPEQVEMAVRQAIERGLTTAKRLRSVAENRSATIRTKIERLVLE